MAEELQAGSERTDCPGVILAAGFGSRLAGVSGANALKPLMPVAGVPLLQRTLIGLKRAGCTRAVVVLGHQAEALRASIESSLVPTLPLQFVVNDRYELANGVSLLAARGHVSDQFMVTMADHVFGPEVMALAGAHRPPPDGASLLVDSKLETFFDMEDATKVLAHDGKLTKIGKQLAEFNCVDTGLFVCTGALLEALAAVDRDQADATLSEGVQRLAESGRMTVVDIGSGFWQDIDTPAMLEHAERRLAQLEATQLCRSAF